MPQYFPAIGELSLAENLNSGASVVAGLRYTERHYYEAHVGFSAIAAYILMTPHYYNGRVSSLRIAF